MAGERATMPVLLTSRLELRPVVEADIGHLITLNADSSVMAYILGRAATPAETRAEWHQRLTKQSNPRHGLGYWLGREAGEFVGWWSASWYGSRPEISGIGYRLCASAWGRGLATEGARAMVAQAFAAPTIESVFASTMAVNGGSRRVLDKIGMAHVKTWAEDWDDPIPGSEFGEVGYELTREAWLKIEQVPRR